MIPLGTDAVDDVDMPLMAPGIVSVVNRVTGEPFWRYADGRSMRALLLDPDGWAEGEPPTGHA